MGILWCGGEDIDFPNGNLTLYWGTGGASYYRTDYVRGALATFNTANYSGTIADAYKSSVFSGGEIVSGWLSARVYQGGYHNLGMLGFGKSGTTKGLFVGCGTTNKFGILTWNGATLTTIWESDVSPSIATLKKWDIQLTGYDQGASGNLKFYIDGVLIFDHTCDMSITGVTGFDSVFATGPYGAACNYYSEVIVSTDDTRALSLKTLAPTGDGTTNQWTGAYTDINEGTINDATEIVTNTADQDEQYNVTDLPAGTFSIQAVKLVTRAAKSAAASISTLKLGVNEGGSINVDAGRSLTTAWTTYERLMLQNPTSSADWQQSEMDGLQIMFRSAT